MSQDNVEPIATGDVALQLVDEMSHWMKEAGVVDTESWKKGLHREVRTSNDRNVQRFWLNRHWRNLFNSFPMDRILESREARGCLMDGECPLPEYIRKFRTVVIPCAIRMGILPTAVH